MEHTQASLVAQMAKNLLAHTKRESGCNTGDLTLILGSRRYPGEGNGNALQYSCLENPVARGARGVIVHGVTKSWTRLSD